jgi:diguanylate cyclase (GGDEF)-like protein
MCKSEKPRLTVPSILNALCESEDENQILQYDNKLVCMFISPVLLAGSVINFIVRYFIFKRGLGATLMDSAILLALGLFYETLLRTGEKLNARLVAHITSALFGLFFVYVVLRFYDLIGPSVWLFGIFPIFLSIVQVTRILWAYTSVSLVLSWFYIMLKYFGSGTLTPYFYFVGFVFFTMLFIVSLVIMKINTTRIGKIKRQLGEVRIQAAERKKAEEENKRLALYDQLTGLPNRMLFQELLGKAIRQSIISDTSGYVFFLDIDLFKMINDTMGHTQGDELLNQVGRRLSEVVPENAVVSRIGGDEFLLMFPDAGGKPEIAKTANNILQTISQPFIVNQRKIYITCTMGIARFPSDGGDVESIIKSADLAMYKAKEDGKNRFTFYSRHLNEVVQFELEMMTAMKTALLHGEFELYYQPQFNGTTREVIGFEALIRWNHPTMGLLYPDEFIPIAEKTGLMVPIGEWVLRTACMQNKAWQNEGVAKVPMAVNLSVYQISDTLFAEQIERNLKETGLEPRYLELEITEKVLLKNMKEIKNELDRIKNLGVKITIDDFGTGDSSIYYLKELPVDCLKIPMGFIHGISKSVKDESIISVIMALADILKIEVIAEGVETQKQLDFLNERQCRNIQGYYFSKPMKADDIEDFCHKTLSCV